MSHAFSVGGENNVRHVRKCSLNDGQCWTDMAETLEDRNGSGCGIAIDESSGSENLIIVGGAGVGASVEIIDLATGVSTKSGKDLY